MFLKQGFSLGLLFSRQFLLSGCIWTVGDGTHIRVMVDRWLRDEHRSWVPSLQHEGVYSLYVSDLMLLGDQSWEIKLFCSFQLRFQVLFWIPLCLP